MRRQTQAIRRRCENLILTYENGNQIDFTITLLLSQAKLDLVLIGNWTANLCEMKFQLTFQKQCFMTFSNFHFDELINVYKAIKP